jgi:DHA2 family multidrug resistance protein
MPLAGLLINRIDPRWIVGAGYALGAAAMYEMTALTPDATFWQITWPRFVQGLGIGLMFVPLSTVALAAVPAGELAHASGLFSFIRTIGGSVGIAIVTTLLERGRQVHQARLVEHVSLYDPEVWQRHQGLVATLAARGADEVSAQQQAWAVLYGSVQKQALFLSFMDNFWRLAWMFCLLIPLLALMGRPRRASPVGRPA